MQPTPWTGAPKRPKVCTGCGATFMPRGGRSIRCYTCRSKQESGRHLPKGTKPCGHCAQPFEWHPKVRMQYCSEPCAYAARKAKTGEGKATLLPWAACITCREWFLARYGRTLCNNDSCTVSTYGWTPRGTLVESTCRVCDRTFQYITKTRPPLACSPACRKEAGSDSRRRSKATRRKRENYQRRHYRRSDIFNRDGWRCQICKRKTRPKAQVPHLLAPTIDHIVPLSRGGADTPENVQTAHFKCNSRKRNGAANDQLRLVG